MQNTSMGTLSHEFTQPHPGQKTADSLAALRVSVEGLGQFLGSVGRNSIRWFLTALLLLFLFLPSLAVVAFVILRVNRATREIRQKIPMLAAKVEAAKEALRDGKGVYEALGFDQLTPQEYAGLKMNQDRWLASERNLRRQVETVRKSRNDLRGKKGHQLPAASRFRRLTVRLTWPLVKAILRPFWAFYLAYRDYNEHLTVMLHLFDASHQDGLYFKNRSEDELWQRRSKVYEYLV